WNLTLKRGVAPPTPDTSATDTVRSLVEAELGRWRRKSRRLLMVGPLLVTVGGLPRKFLTGWTKPRFSMSARVAPAVSGPRGSWPPAELARVTSLSRPAPIALTWVLFSVPETGVAGVVFLGTAGAVGILGWMSLGSNVSWSWEFGL